MRIVIAGAGAIGFHLAKLLCSERQDIILIDTNREVLQYAAHHIDALTIHGDSASLAILKEAQVDQASLFIAVTASEKNNIFSAILAKKMGAKQAISRVNNPEFLAEENRNSFDELGIDALFSPLQLAAKEIYRLVKQEVMTDAFEFEGGKLMVTGFTLDRYSPLVNRSVKDIQRSFSEEFMPMAILRGNQTYLPRENTLLLPKDHVYFISKPDQLKKLKSLIGKTEYKVKNIMLIGGSDLTYLTASLLEKEYHVSIVEEDKECCKDLINKLHDTLVIQGNYSNLDLLREEGLEDMDAFIALTDNTETNILSCLVSQQVGRKKKSIALVENVVYTHISQNIGVDTLINKKLIAANYIFRYVRKGAVKDIAGLHGVDAEVIEFEITKNNRLTKNPIKKVRFPDQAIIGAVLRGEDIHFVTGEFTLQINDKVIVFALPEAIAKVEKLFR